MTRLDRRTFLKGVGIASAASVASGSGSAFAAVSGVPLPASAPAWRRTPCRLCGVGCGLLVGIEGGRAVAVKGDPDSPVSGGAGVRQGLQLRSGPLRARPDPPGDGPTRWEVGARTDPRGLRSGGATDQGDDGAARQGQRGAVRLRPVDDRGRLHRVQAVQGWTRHQQPGYQCPALRGQRECGAAEHLRRRRRDWLLRRHRSRRHLRALGHQPGGDRPGPLLPDAGSQTRQSGRADRCPLHPNRSY